MRKLALALAAAAMVLSCGPRKKQASEPKSREFPQVVVPAMVEDETARINYAAEHFWDAFVKGDYPTDSLHIAGVKKDEVELIKDAVIKLDRNELKALKGLEDK